MNIHRILDRVRQWWRYPQPSWLQQQLLGQYTDVIDTDFTAARLASEESVRYVQQHMRAVPNFDTDYDLHEWVATTQLYPKLKHGAVLEFGVATGRTLNHFARLLPHCRVHGFDSFQGLPEDWTSRMPKGFFGRSQLPPVAENCQLWVGWFDQTLPQYAIKHGDDAIQLLHIDCDLYSSTVTVLETVRKNLVYGSVIIFDEYINYPGWQQDEYRAWQEFCAKYNIQYQYIGRVSRHQQVAIRVTHIGA